MDESQYTVEWMVTPARQASRLDVASLMKDNNFVRIHGDSAVETDCLGASHPHYVRKRLIMAERFTLDAKASNRARRITFWGCAAWRYTLAGPAEKGPRRRMDPTRENASGNHGPARRCGQVTSFH